MVSKHNYSVSVVLIAKRLERTIVPTLESLKRQTFPPEEVILVVDSLEDSEMSALNSYAVRIIESEIGGIGAARRRGVESATSDIVAFIDSDCVADASWLEALVRVFAERDDVVAQTGRIISSNPALGAERLTGYPKPRKDVWVDFAETMNFAFVRRIISIIGNFDANFGDGGEDLDFCVRLKKEGYYVLFNPRAMMFHLRSEKWVSKAWRDGKTRAKNFLKHRMSLYGPACAGFAHSISLVASVFLLGMGMHVIALAVLSPSLTHRAYRAMVTLRQGHDVKYALRNFVLAYLNSLSFTFHSIALAFSFPPRSTRITERDSA